MAWDWALRISNIHNQNLIQETMIVLSRQSTWKHLAVIRTNILTPNSFCEWLFDPNHKFHGDLLYKLSYQNLLPFELPFNLWLRQ